MFEALRECELKTWSAKRCVVEKVSIRAALEHEVLHENQ